MIELLQQIPITIASLFLFFSLALASLFLGRRFTIKAGDISFESLPNNKEEPFQKEDGRYISFSITKLLIFSALLFLASSLFNNLLIAHYCDEKITYQERGLILDKDSQEPITQANVFITTGTSCVSDSKGKFTLSIESNEAKYKWLNCCNCPESDQVEINISYNGTTSIYTIPRPKANATGDNWKVFDFPSN